MIGRFFRKKSESKDDLSPVADTDVKTDFSQQQVLGTVEAFADDILRRNEKRLSAKLSRDETKNQHLRTEERSSCFTVGQLSFPDAGVTLEGVILDASRFGVSFRPASRFIEHRVGEQAHLSVEGVHRVGIIRATRPNGYGIQLMSPLEDADRRAIVDASLQVEGIPPAA